MIRDKIFVKFAIVFGIGVLLFGSIIFFVKGITKMRNI